MTEQDLKLFCFSVKSHLEPGRVRYRDLLGLTWTRLLASSFHHCVLSSLNQGLPRQRWEIQTVNRFPERWGEGDPIFLYYQKKNMAQWLKAREWECNSLAWSWISISITYQPYNLWESHLTSLSLGFLLCKMKIVVPITFGRLLSKNSWKPFIAVPGLGKCLINGCLHYF